MKIDKLRLRRIDDLLQNEIDQGRLPGYALAIGLGDEVIYKSSYGHAENMDGMIRPMTIDTIFDLASLTKVVATLPSMLMLIDRGQIRLHDPVAKFIPSFSIKSKSGVTIQHLLTHSSGLPSHREYFAYCHSREEIINMVNHEKLEIAPNKKVVYSDLGFILLGEIVQIVTDTTLDDYAREQIFEPIGMKDTMYHPPEELWTRIAATEKFQITGVKVGVVHDENAYKMGGVSGHAGLFAPLEDLILYVQMWLQPKASVLSEAVKNVAMKCHTTHLSGRRGLGWSYRGDSYDHAGDLWPETTVGHTGFTGTSLTMDPNSKLWTVLLTNEVHYGREKRIMRDIRGRVHNLIGAALVNI